MGDGFDNFAIDVLGELHCPLSPTRGAYPSAFTGERDKERVFAAVAVYPGGATSEDTAIEVLVEGLYYLIPQAPILMLEKCLPLEL